MRLLFLLALLAPACSPADPAAEAALDLGPAALPLEDHRDLLLVEVDGLKPDTRLDSYVHGLISEGIVFANAHAPSPDPEQAHRSHQLGRRPTRLGDGGPCLAALLEEAEYVVVTGTDEGARGLEKLDAQRPVALLLRMTVDDLEGVHGLHERLVTLGRAPLVSVVGLPSADEDPFRAARVFWSIAAPGEIPDQRVEHAVSTLDLHATLAALLDLAPPAGGVESTPQLPGLRAGPVFLEHVSDDRLVGHGVIDEHWRSWRSRNDEGELFTSRLDKLTDPREDDLLGVRLQQLGYATMTSDRESEAYAAFVRLEKLLTDRE